MSETFISFISVVPVLFGAFYRSREFLYLENVVLCIPTWLCSCVGVRCVSFPEFLQTTSFNTPTSMTSASYHYREILLPHVPERVRSFLPRSSRYTPLSTFSQQVNAGLNSSAFDIEANLRDGDSRVGLDEQGTQEVLKIMSREHVKYGCLVMQRSLTYLQSSASIKQD